MQLSARVESQPELVRARPILKDMLLSFAAAGRKLGPFSVLRGVRPGQAEQGHPPTVGGQPSMCRDHDTHIVVIMCVI